MSDRLKAAPLPVTVVRDQPMPRYAYPASQGNGTLTVRNSGSVFAGGRLSVSVNGEFKY